MSLKLYYTPGTCSQSPHIILREAGLDFTLDRVAKGTKQTESGQDYRNINPLGYVPALEIEPGVVLTEGPAIVQYLADLAPEKNLAPANGSVARYQLQSRLNFISTELHKSYGPLFNPATPAEYKTMAQETLGKRLDYVEHILSQQAYLMGDHFTVVDAYLFVVSGWSPFVGVDLARWPYLQAYRARIAARPTVQDALRAEGLLK